jgi:hypothetical protein
MDQHYTKNGPGRTGATNGRSAFRNQLGCGGGILLQCDQRSETEIREIAVAHCDAGVRHQNAIDGGREAAEYRDGRRDAERGGLGHCSLGHCGLGHLDPLLRGQRRCIIFRANLGMPDASNNPSVCIAAYCVLQRSIDVVESNHHDLTKQKAAGKPAAFENLPK